MVFKILIFNTFLNQSLNNFWMEKNIENYQKSYNDLSKSSDEIVTQVKAEFSKWCILL